MVYLHWGASTLFQDLEAALPGMRSGYVDYACARFIGHCHTRIRGMNSLGCSNLHVTGLEPVDEGTPIYPLVMSALAQSDVVRVNVDEWIVESPDGTVQLDRERAGSEDGLGHGTAEGRERQAQAIRDVDAMWAGKDRPCPKCGTVFRSRQNRGGCPSCGHIFHASHPYGLENDP